MTSDTKRCSLSAQRERDLIGKDHRRCRFESAWIMEQCRRAICRKTRWTIKVPPGGRKRTKRKERRTDGKITWDERKEEAKRGYTVKKRMERNARIARRRGGGERRYSYIVITRRARSTAECQRCFGTRNEKATQGERGVAEYDYVGTTHVREKRKGGERKRERGRATLKKRCRA